MHSVVEKVTNRIIERSKAHRQRYLQRVAEAKGDGVFRNKLPCSNLAHDLAGCVGTCRSKLLDDTIPNIGIISAYNDMVSAHQPYGKYPEIIKASVAKAGGNAQFAGGVPAMCDGVTQGEPGMDMSLVSRDVIAMSTVIGLSHNVFDGAILLGVCDKILPGLLMGGLQFGHLPMILIPAGPMTSGIANKDKIRSGRPLPRVRSVTMNCSPRRSRPITAPEPAHSTERQIPTSLWLKCLVCIYRVAPLSTLELNYVMPSPDQRRSRSHH